MCEYAEFTRPVSAARCAHATCVFRRAALRVWAGRRACLAVAARRRAAAGGLLPGA